VDGRGQRRQESETIKEAVLAKVKQLNPQWDLAQLDQFQTSLAQRDAIEALEQELHDIQRQMDKIESRRPDLTDEIARKESELEQMSDIESVPALERLVECAVAYQADRDTAADLTEQIEDADTNLRVLRQQLEMPLGTTIEDAVALPIPLPATLKKYHEELAELTNSLKDAARRLDEAEKNTADKRHDLSSLDSQVRIPDRERLLAQRERRDAGWRLIRRKHITQDSNVNDEQITEWLNEAGESLPDQYEREVATADELADQRQEKAEIVARREHIAAENALAVEREGSLRNRRTQLEGDHHQLHIQWENVWNDCGFTPLSPEEMLVASQ
jgi:chromosome segregation ATPase